MTESQPKLRETIPLDEGALKNSEPVEKQNKIGLIIGAVVVLGLLITGLVFLLQPGTDTARVRDIFIIFMAFESLVIGIALVVLVLQIASLINLLQNEVKPILEATAETVNTLRGTTEFLGENLVEPVIKLNSYLAGLRKFFDLIPIKRKK